jgi:hypothetical protein
MCGLGPAGVLTYVKRAVKRDTRTVTPRVRAAGVVVVRGRPPHADALLPLRACRSRDRS